MKRFYLHGALMLAVMGGVFMLAQKPVYAVNCYTNFYCQYGVAKTYFSSPTQTSEPGNIVWARCDILPQPALRNINTVDGSQDFIKIVHDELFAPVADPGCHNIAKSTGAAFIVDAMLGYNGGTNGNPAGGGTFAAVRNAQTQWQAWVDLVNAYQAANNDPTSPYKVYWNYWISPANFCGSLDSGYDWTRDDPVFYRIPSLNSGGCPYNPSGDYVVRFVFPGGTFDIDKPCGNLSGVLDKIPVLSVSKPPTGTLTLKCVAGQEVADVTFSDPDGPTSAVVAITGSSWPGQQVSSSPAQVTLPPYPTTTPYNNQTVTLTIKDYNPTGPPGNSVVVSASTGPILPCVAPGCGSKVVTPAYVDPFMKFSMTVAVTFGVGQTPPPQTPGQFTLTANPAIPGVTNPQTATIGNGVATATFANLGPAGASGQYSLQWTYTNGGTNQPCSDSLVIAYMPYLNVYGGDVAVGESPNYTGSVSQCMGGQPANKQGIFSWNNHNAGYTGAGAQYAVQALAGIVDFANALSSSNTVPTGLSFANFYSPADPSKINAAQGLFGGYFGATSSDCNFTSDLTMPPTTSNTTIPATSVGAGVSTIQYVSGADVYISGNVTYASAGGWANVTQIPYFKLVVVGGDIYIDRNVTQLDGIYIAESTGASGTTGGHIYTCATGLGSPVNLATAGAYTTCKKQLVINGAFVARQVVFGRTYGTVGQAAGDTLNLNHDAEVFNYTPEIWLPRNSSAPANGYTAITGLPPVL